MGESETRKDAIFFSPISRFSDSPIQSAWSPCSLIPLRPAYVLRFTSYVASAHDEPMTEEEASMS